MTPGRRRAAASGSGKLAPYQRKRDFARTPEQRQILRLVLASLVLGRPIFAPPEIPDARKDALRNAFDLTMKDPQFLAEADKAKMDINAITGEESQAIADSIVNTPAEIIARAKVVLGDLLK